MDVVTTEVTIVRVRTLCFIQGPDMLSMSFLVSPPNHQFQGPSSITGSDLGSTSYLTNSWGTTSIKPQFPVGSTLQTRVYALTGCSYCSDDGADCIFMILNYKYPAIWAIGVGTTDDALGKYGLAAVSEEREQFCWHVESIFDSPSL